MAKAIYTVEKLYQEIKDLDENLPKGVEITNPIKNAIETGKTEYRNFYTNSCNSSSKKIAQKRRLFGEV